MRGDDRVARREGTGHVDPAALVEWGSITKCVTAAGVLAAADEGLLDLDQPVRVVVPRADRATYTPRDLIEHRSGLLRVPLGMLLVPRRDPYGPLRGRRHLPERWTRPLGERGAHLYSNTGYAVLGEVLDAVTGDWWRWCRDRVLSPRGVTATLDVTGRQLVLPRDRRGRVRAPWSLADGPFAAAGGLWSTTDDLVRFGTSWGDGTPPAWQTRDGVDLINGATRDSSSCLVRSGEHGVTVIAHVTGPGASATTVAVDALREACRAEGRD